MYGVTHNFNINIFSQFFTIVVVFLGFLVLFITLLHLYFKKIRNKKIRNKRDSIKVLASEVALFLSLLIHPAFSQIYDMFHTSNNSYENLIFSDYYLAPSIKSTKKNHPNFVYIYIESFERTFLNNNIFPDLAVNLQELERNSINFTNLEQNYNTGWTSAGIISSQCGVPLFNTFQNKDFLFTKNLNCVSDLLHTQGYFISLIQGSSLEFGGLGKFYKAHSFDSIKGKDEVIESIGFTPPLNDWGIYDDLLLDQSFLEFMELSINKKKFGLFISTIDTHPAYGYQSKSCNDIKYQDGSNPMLNALKCTDILISSFIKKVQGSKYGDNTIIVISSDHLMMKSTINISLPKGDRRNLFMIIDPRDQKHKLITKPANMFDIGPMLLHSLGFESNVGLGRNILLDIKSLSHTLANFNNNLERWSDEIIDFWTLIQISTNINIGRNELSINGELLNFPIMMKIDNDLKVKMLTSFERAQTVNNFIADLNADDLFIWIDRCKYIKGPSYSNKNCYIMGKLGNTMDSYELSTNKLLTLETLNNTIKESGSSLNYINNYKDLNEKVSKITYQGKRFYENFYGLIKSNVNPKIKYYIKSSLFSIIDKFQNILSNDKETIVIGNQKEFNQDTHHVQRFIAHGAGQIDGYKYTNSLEALNYSYEKGFRIFELDIIKTKDGVYVASHDWKLWSEQTSYKKGIPPSLDEFLKHKIYNKFTPLDLEGINDWFLNHPDAILVTDKVNTPIDFSEKFIDKDRLMMELFTWEAVKNGLKANIKSVMPSSNILFDHKERDTLPSKLLKLGITDVAVPYSSVSSHNNFFVKLKDNNINIFVFGVNHYKHEDELYVLCNNLHNIYGMYADVWDFPNSIDCKE